ncbi:DNA cytosine methyltransferase [Lentzea terrae]|uniref:DNA cytosine methyltransferase n=1 Tax=Lentzea terrae TaxID=2200761 RepID=UPI000DD3F69D|nr:DNA cytosine methyltransferase [Lentzea terrae]
MKRRPRLLDLFCCGGGASAGYHAAGFDVTGVDIEPQPYYPFPFIQADALTVDLSGYDVIAASPPCQRFCKATPADRRDDHPDLVDPIRQRLRDAVARGDAFAYVIENVPGAPLEDPIKICGDSLRLGVRRHRLFESNLDLYGTPCHHDRSAPSVPVYGSYNQRPGRKPLDGDTSPLTFTTDEAREAMGIDWLPWPYLTQAIPPPFTMWLGVQLLGHARHRAKVRKVTEPAGKTRELAGQTSLDMGFSAALPSPEGDESPELRASVTTRTCRCGNQLIRPDTGRWPRHCSHACRQAAYRDRTKRSAA